MERYFDDLWWKTINEICWHCSGYVTTWHYDNRVEVVVILGACCVQKNSNKLAMIVITLLDHCQSYRKEEPFVPSLQHGYACGWQVWTRFSWKVQIRNIIYVSANVQMGRDKQLDEFVAILRRLCGRLRRVGWIFCNRHGQWIMGSLKFGGNCLAHCQIRTLMTGKIYPPKSGRNDIVNITSNIVI